MSPSAGGRAIEGPIGGECLGCGTPDLIGLFSAGSVPANSCVLLDTADEAAAFPRGALEIVFCDTCGLLSNRRFDRGLTEYSNRYEETQGFSQKFMDYASGLARRWVTDFGLAERTVVEIGCGKGEFLIELAKAGVGRCIGFDPTIDLDRIDAPGDLAIEWIADLYDERFAGLEPGAIVCRHTLEHIPDVRDFMTMLRRNLGDRHDTVVLFEVPDVQRVLDEVAFWDVYYEHCSYFSVGSLVRLFRSAGFDPIEVRREYDDQYLTIAARPSDGSRASALVAGEDDLDRLRRGVAHFRAGYDEVARRWGARIASTAAQGRRVVIWGASSKGVSLITNLNLGDELAAVVDINPHKWGKYMVGSGHRIVAPSDLVDLRPHVVVAMNPVYLDEIGTELAALGVDAELTAL